MYSIFELVKVFKLRIFKNVILKILKLIYNLKKIFECTKVHFKREI